MLADATQGASTNIYIHLTMQPTRPRLADCLRVLDLLDKQAGARIDGTSAHRRVIAPEHEHGLVLTMGPNGMYRANTVGTFGVVSAGRNWGRLASASHRWGLKLVGKAKVYLLLFPVDAIFSNENEIFDEMFLAFISFLLIIGYPMSEKKLWAKGDLVWLGFSLNIPEKSVEFSRRNEDSL